jgi:hypothetical protein
MFKRFHGCDEHIARLIKDQYHPQRRLSGPIKGAEPFRLQPDLRCLMDLHELAGFARPISRMILANGLIFDLLALGKCCAAVPSRETG